MKKFVFYVMVYPHGAQQVSAFVRGRSINNIAMLLGQFQSVSELEWIRSEVINARNAGERTYAGQNTLEMYITGELAEIWIESQKRNLQYLPTDFVIEFIDGALDFYRLYHSGSIPGLVLPEIDS